MYRAMPDEEGIAGKSGLTKKAKPNEEAHFFPKFPMKRALPSINCPIEKYMIKSLQSTILMKNL